VFAVADASTGFKLSPEVLEAAITPATKWLILNTPSNPTGAAYTAAELQGLADVLLRHPHVHILTDDIYEVLVYDGGVFATIAQVEPALQSAYADHEWRLQVACHDRLAHWLLHGPATAAGGDD
jgi:aspartate aminotransferase